MTVMIIVFLGISLSFVGFLLLASRKLSRYWRLGAAASGFAIVALSFIALTELMSWPKPARLEFFRKHILEIEIIAARIIKDEGIYILAQLPGEKIPRYYVLPYDQKLVDEMRKGMSQKGNPGMRLRRPFNWDKSWEHRDEPKIYTPPPEKLPPKLGEDEPETFKDPKFAI